MDAFRRGDAMEHSEVKCIFPEYKFDVFPFNTERACLICFRFKINLCT